MKSYGELIGTHAGETGFIFGAGTSLFKIMKHKEYKKVFDDNVNITINASILATEWEEGNPEKRYWTSNDVACMHWTYWEKVLKSKCRKLIRDSWKEKHDVLKPYEEFFYEFSPRTGWDNAPTTINELLHGEGVVEPKTDEEKDLAIKEKELGLCAISSIPSAIDFAIQVGCKNIFLLGVDHYMSGKLSHFWEYFPKNKQPVVKPGGFKATHRMQNAMFEENMKTYASLERFAKKKGSEIFLCNPKSRVNCFNKIEFNEALEMI